MNLDELNKVALAMVAPGKGILAADESTGTIKKRFDAIGTENTEDNRRDYREMLFRSTEAMKNHISGVILYDETIWQKGQRRHAAGRDHQEGRRHPRHQGRRRHQAAAVLRPAKSSPSASTSSPTGCRNITSRARASPNGGR